MSDGQASYTGGFVFEPEKSTSGTAAPQADGTQPVPAPAPEPAQPAPTAPSAPLADFVEPGANPPQDQGGLPGYTFAERMKSFTTTIVLPAHSLNLDNTLFLNLLAGSISLSKDEKKRIVDSIPKLRQEQVDELIRIFDEERAKFVELSPKHGAQLKKLEDQHLADWKDLELSYKAESQKKEDQNKAEEIRKQLGL